MHKFETGDMICRKVIPNDEIYCVIRCEERGYYVKVFFETLNEEIVSNFEGIFIIIPYAYEDMYELKERLDLDVECNNLIGIGGIRVVHGLSDKKICDIISMYQKGYTPQQIENETICDLHDVEAVIRTFKVIDKKIQEEIEIQKCEYDVLDRNNKNLSNELNELYRKIALKLLEK